MILLLLATPMMRPLILSEKLSIVGVAVGACAALVAWRSDQNADERPRMRRTDKAVLLWTGLLWLWVLLLLGLRPATFGIPQGQAVRGVISVVGLLGCALIVLRDPDRRHQFTKGLAVMVLASCGLYCVTLAYWMVAGLGSGVFMGIDLGIQGGPTGFAFPLTPLYGAQTFSGVTVDRFLSIGREAGVGSIVIAWAFLMLDRVGLSRWWWKAILLIGLVGTLSTAGFAIFIVAWVLDRWVMHTGPATHESILKQWTGFGMMSGAVWLAVNAPFLGIQEKTTRDGVSASDRTNAFSQGISALLHYPIGRPIGLEENGVSGISIIASAVQIGVPGVVLSIAAFLVPLAVAESFALAFAPIGLILTNALVAQPALQSTAYLLLVALACWQRDDRPGDLEIRGDDHDAVSASAAST